MNYTFFAKERYHFRLLVVVLDFSVLAQTKGTSMIHKRTISTALMSFGSFAMIAAGAIMITNEQTLALRGGTDQGPHPHAGEACTGHEGQNCPSKVKTVPCSSSVQRCKFVQGQPLPGTCAAPLAPQTCSGDPNCEEWAYQECQ